MGGGGASVLYESKAIDMLTIKFKSRLAVTSQFLHTHNWSFDRPVIVDKKQNHWCTHLIRYAIKDIKRGKQALCYNPKQLRDIKECCKALGIKIVVDDTEKEYYYIIKRRK